MIGRRQPKLLPAKWTVENKKYSTPQRPDSSIQEEPGLWIVCFLYFQGNISKAAITEDVMENVMEDVMGVVMEADTEMLLDELGHVPEAQLNSSHAVFRGFLESPVFHFYTCGFSITDVVEG